MHDLADDDTTSAHRGGERARRGHLWRAPRRCRDLADEPVDTPPTVAPADEPGDEPAPEPEPEPETGEVDGAVVAVGLPPVPPSSGAPQVAVGLPPVPPSSGAPQVAVGKPPVPPSSRAPQVAVGKPPVPTPGGAEARSGARVAAVEVPAIVAAPALLDSVSAAALDLIGSCL